MTFFANLTQSEAIIIGFLITGIIGPTLAFLLNKFFGRKVEKVDLDGKLQGMVDKSMDQANSAIDQLAEEREARKKESRAWEEKYSALEKRLRDLEHIQTGPYLLTTETEFNTQPVPSVVRQTHKLELLPVKT